MKKKIMVIAILAAGSAAMAQDKIPAVVKESFKKLYPGITASKWEIDEGNFEAEFKKGKEEWEIEFDASGNLVKSELELNSVSQLPKPVQDVLKKDYAAYKPKEFEQVTLASGKVVYETEVKMEGKKYELQFDETGKLVSKIEDIESK